MEWWNGGMEEWNLRPRWTVSHITQRNEVARSKEPLVSPPNQVLSETASAGYLA
jgi:hypothetical protein